MSKEKSIYKRLCQSIENDEQFCLICNRNMNNRNSIDTLLYDSSICEMCRNQFILHRTIYQLDIEYIVLYEYNEFLERLLFRYKEQKDVVLAPIFFEQFKDKLIHLSYRYCICTMCSSDDKRQERGFEPIVKMLESLGIEVYSPLYKSENRKQSNQTFQNRKDIQSIIYKKELYELPNKPILLIDDVCTTSYTIQRGIELLKPKKVLLLCAHPTWIDSMKVVKHKKF